MQDHGTLYGKLSNSNKKTPWINKKASSFQHAFLTFVPVPLFHLSSKLVTSWLWAPTRGYWFKTVAFISAALPKGLFPEIPWPVTSDCWALPAFIPGVLLSPPPISSFALVVSQPLGREQRWGMTATVVNSVWKWGGEKTMLQIVRSVQLSFELLA